VPPSRFASFAIALPLYRVFEYRIDDGEPVVAGTRYRLPFGKGTRTGVALGVSDSTDYAAERIKPIETRIDRKPVLSEHMLALAKWMSEYYLQPPGEVIFQCLPGYLRGSRAHQSLRVKRWRLVDSDADAIERLRRRSPRQFEIGQALLGQPGGMTAAQLKQVNPNWHAVVKSMEGKKVLRWEWVDVATNPVIAGELPRLSEEQAAILDEIEPCLSHFAVHLLDGVTGSGKTEIYLRLIQARLADGLQVIYLVPEIGLTNQLIDRVRQRFGDCFVTSHSGLT
jgi:primosomal protein N' (replication factor Y)